MESFGLLSAVAGNAVAAIDADGLALLFVDDPPNRFGEAPVALNFPNENFGEASPNTEDDGPGGLEPKLVKGLLVDVVEDRPPNAGACLPASLVSDESDLNSDFDTDDGTNEMFANGLDGFGLSVSDGLMVADDRVFAVTFVD